MPEGNCNEICREHLVDESEDSIRRENGQSYDQAYTVIGLLIDKQKVCNWSDVEKQLIFVNKLIVKRFQEKFIKKAAVQGLCDQSLL